MAYQLQDIPEHSFKKGWKLVFLLYDVLSGDHSSLFKYMQEHLLWYNGEINWNICFLKRGQWSDKSRFLLHTSDSETKILGARGIEYHQSNIQEEVGGGSVLIKGSRLYGLKLDLWYCKATSTAKDTRNKSLKESCCLILMIAH